ncbi:MAG: hypothetical protein V4638_08170 [Bacteroidota bacterium]
MSRIHLFEFEDQQWFPTFLRNYLTDFLQFLSNKTKLFQPAVPLIKEALIKSNSKQIIDLGSGGGGGLLSVHAELLKEDAEIQLKLSDYYPNIAAFEHIKAKNKNIDFVPISVDARNVPIELQGLRTQFLSLHHFKPEDARKILQNAVDSNNSIAIFEAQERSVPSILAMIFSPISVLLTTPFIRPFKFGRIIFTYLIPIVPIAVMWDGIVSSLRTYSVQEMNELVNSLKNTDHYEWKIGKVKSGPGKVLYLIGTKK